ncbi:MAG TPA: hypothetical protein VD710_02585 [Nitrososphaeraceae archaeon]|nr:hypothetical protein [Nitrososphaeraceae archaeon]
MLHEIITPDSYLIRNHFNDYTVTRKAEGISRHSIRSIFYQVLCKSGINANVQMMHGFRKFFTTQLIDSDVNPEIREMLLGHKIGLASAYYRPSEQKMYDEYQKAVNNLTINEENRLKIKVQKLESQRTDYERLDAKIDALARASLGHNVYRGGPPPEEGGNGRPLTEQEIEDTIQWNRMKRIATRRAEKKLMQESNE